MNAQAILDWALQTGLSVSVLILIVMVFRRPVAKYMGAKTAYALWALPVIRLFLPAIPILPAKAVNTPAVIAPATNVREFISLPATVLETTPSALNWSVVFITIWIAGAGAFLLWQAIRQRRFTSELSRSTQAPLPSLELKLVDAASRLGSKKLPAIRLSSQGCGPLVTGLWRPVIVLPENFETDFTEEQQIHALAHELSHIRHGDLWIAAGATIFRALNWPNPLVHMAAPQFRADQEAACDARVIASLGDDRSTKTAYADTLLRAARLSRNPVSPLPVGLTMSNPLKERLMILKNNPSKRRSLRLALAASAATALIVTAPLTAAQAPTPPAPPEMDVTVQSVDKQVLKWVTKENGVETKKHIEIITEDGVTKAWEIDEIGNRFEISTDSIDMPMHMGNGEGKVRMMMNPFGEGAHMSEKDIELMIAKSLEGVDIEEMIGENGERKVIVKRMGPDGEMNIVTENILGGHGIDGKNVIVMESHGMVDLSHDGENSFVFHSGDHMKSKPGMMVDVATKMMDGVNTDDMDRSTRKKVEAAQKALKEAQEALAEAE